MDLNLTCHLWLLAKLGKSCFQDFPLDSPSGPERSIMFFQLLALCSKMPILSQSIYIRKSEYLEEASTVLPKETEQTYQGDWLVLGGQ